MRLTLACAAAIGALLSRSLVRMLGVSPPPETGVPRKVSSTASIDAGATLMTTVALSHTAELGDGRHTW